ncbi:MAG TPA: hypothetical protein VHG71_10150 [Verrucomicrobiae bacterium]|nr:hypothetical protein [Verrucomicrobiae bacterium]
MKQYWSTAFAILCVALVVALIVSKRGDNAQHQTDIGAITDFSNRLDSAQTQIAIGQGTIAVFSNKLDQARSESSAFSNQLVEAQSAIQLGSEQITNLTRQIAEIQSENQKLSGNIVDLTNQVTALMKQVALTEAGLTEANKNYALLENRFRRDVAERVVVERKFNNPMALQEQLDDLKQNPVGIISAESIYASLDVEVKSNGTFHVISPN